MKISIGILAYNGQRYFEKLFKSLFNQSYKDIEILVLDNASSDNDAEFLQKKYGNRIKIIRSNENLGFAKGHNRLIKESRGEFYLCANQDMYFEKDFVFELLKVIEKDKKIASVGGKILSFNNLIDTVGIKMHFSHYAEDEGQSEEDIGQYDEEKEIFASSACSCLYRKSALGDIDYFDEDFFMYKEDIDLGYRLLWAGYKNMYTPKAVAYHDRTAVKLARKNKSFLIRSLSVQNHFLMFRKNFSKNFSFKVRLLTYLRNLALKIWIYVFERDIISFVHNGEMQEIKKIKKRVSAHEIEKYFI
jgi:GT2 family glycosyltransferase